MVNLRLTEPLKETDKSFKNSKTKKEVQLQDKRHFSEFSKHDFPHTHTDTQKTSIGGRNKKRVLIAEIQLAAWKTK